MNKKPFYSCFNIGIFSFSISIIFKKYLDSFSLRPYYLQKKADIISMWKLHSGKTSGFVCEIMDSAIKGRRFL